MHYGKNVFQSVMKWWRDHRRQPDIRVFSAVEVDVSGTPLEPPNYEEAIAGQMRGILGDEAFGGQQHLVKQRDGFKTALANATNDGLSGRGMAEFLNGHAFIWSYLYEKAESDPQFLAMIERALMLCENYVPEHWHRAVKNVDENREHHAALRRKYDV